MVTVSIGEVLISGVHAHVKKIHRKFLWSEMEIISQIQKPWVVVGDFNAIISPEEKFGGKAPNRSSMMDFLNCLNECNLIQAPSTGQQYTWSNCQQGTKRILCVLDRAVFNSLWLQKYGDWGYKKLKNLKKVLSEWNWSIFGNINTKIKEAEVKVQKAMELSDQNPLNEDLLANLVAAQNEYATREVQANTLMRLKSRAKWIKDGSANTAYFMLE
ncbi:uncharacterized protein LOC113342057 [Papaver somniferum]|uniref:uncharacterized protein LOC113342057 n=1 Tax=Papaver somniferum TaxID=3469 RepID=UPI000E700AB6|nr:uncharacterized protein LOC113342057 [Papaver somniferum]